MSVLKAINKLKKRVENVNVLIEESCKDIASRAQASAPLGISVTATGNVITARGPIGDEEFAAHMEFGTGRFAQGYTATLPEEWDKYAEDVFFRTGKGTRQEDPYLFPAYEVERVNLINEIKKSFNG